MERYHTVCPDGPHFLTRPQLFTQEELELFSRPLNPANERIDDWLVEAGGIHGQPPERVFRALHDILGLTRLS